MRLIFKKITSHLGQGTVEAAFVLPILMTLILLLLQPAIYLYDLIVMNSAASETVRLLATNSGTSDNVEDYVRRRLSAIPQVDLFHLHASSCSYSIETWKDEEGMCGVRIKNEIKPLPLIDLGLSATSSLNERGNILLDVTKEMRMQPEWK